MKKTLRYEKRLAATREDAMQVMKTYKREIDLERARMNASKYGFVRTCCHQNIDQLKTEKDAIEAELVG